MSDARRIRRGLWALVMHVILPSQPYLIVPYAMLGLGFAAAGWAIVRHPDLPAVERRITGGGMALLGLIQLTYPTATGLPRLMPAGFALSSALQTIAALGVLLTYFRWLNICQGCRSIRTEKGPWDRLERYVSARSGTSFSHGICPSCLEEHFGPYLRV